ncbi:MAG: CYTH domain-containing protein [Salibacteraceae bacterium]|jgi:CYTH domain-containing protein
MAIEIEYKFLVDREKWNALSKPEPSLIVQAYIHNSKEVTVRVRIKGTSAYLTIKGQTIGVIRSEFEYEIPISDAEEMIEQFSTKHIRKYRYEIPMGKHTWEVDVFEGKLEGLILAEVELDSEDEVFEKPEWITEDVSTDASYYNAVLIEKC